MNHESVLKILRKFCLLVPMMMRSSIKSTNAQCRSLRQDRAMYQLNTQPVTRRDMRAVVVGGGISGLLSAHILAPYCDSIAIVDKDELSRAPKVGWNPSSEVSIDI